MLASSSLKTLVYWAVLVVSASSTLLAWPLRLSSAYSSSECVPTSTNGAPGTWGKGKKRGGVGCCWEKNNYVLEMFLEGWCLHIVVAIMEWFTVHHVVHLKRSVILPWLALLRRTGFSSEKNCCYSFLSIALKRTWMTRRFGQVDCPPSGVARSGRYVRAYEMALCGRGLVFSTLLYVSFLVNNSQLFGLK